jgi:uncharacterized membrane protein HdeD (DUF308 family)
MRRVLFVALILLGVALIAVGIVYLVEPARHLPSFFPGHSKSHHHGVKHGWAAIVAGVVALLLAVVARPRSGRRRA